MVRISGQWRGGQSQAAGQRRRSRRPGRAYLETRASGRERPRCGLCRGARPGRPLGRRRKGGSQRCPPGRPLLRGARAFPPRSFLSLRVSAAIFFLKFLIAVEIKHLLVPSRPRAGRVPAVLRAPRRAGAGLPAQGWRELRAQPPPGLAVGRPRAEYLCYILKNLNK